MYARLSNTLQIVYYVSFIFVNPNAFYCIYLIILVCLMRGIYIARTRVIPIPVMESLQGGILYPDI